MKLDERFRGSNLDPLRWVEPSVAKKEGLSGNGPDKKGLSEKGGDFIRGATPGLSFDISSFLASEGPTEPSFDRNLPLSRHSSEGAAAHRRQRRLRQGAVQREALQAAQAGFEGKHLPLTVRKVMGGFVVPSLVRSSRQPPSSLPPVSLESKDPRLKGIWLVGHELFIGDHTPLKMQDPVEGTMRFDPARSKKLRHRFQRDGTGLVAVRHGESTMNAKAAAGIPTLYGRIDSGLTDLGRAQAEQAALDVFRMLGGDDGFRLRVENPQTLPALVASPLSRAYDTATATSALLIRKIDSLDLPEAVKAQARKAVEVQTDPRIQEYAFGVGEGMELSKLEEDHPAAKERFMRSTLPGADFFHRFPDSETYPSEGRLEMYNRVTDFLHDAAHRYAGRDVVLFAHMGPISAMEGSLLAREKGYAQGDEQVMVDQSRHIQNGVAQRLL